jgi:hypothetical protein
VPFIILEVLGMTTGKNVQVVFFPSYTTIYLGRDSAKDVRVSDQTVSKFHATLIHDYLTNRIILRDSKSRFGTLKLIREPIQLNGALTIQIKNFYLKFDNRRVTHRCFHKLKQCIGLVQADSASDDEYSDA